MTLNEDEVECFSIDSGAEITVKKTDIFVLRRDYATSEAQVCWPLIFLSFKLLYLIFTGFRV